MGIFHVEMVVSGCLSQVAVPIFTMENVAWATRSPALQEHSRDKEEAGKVARGETQCVGRITPCLKVFVIIQVAKSQT